MSGDWIKMRGNLWDDPRVSSLCDLTNQGEAAIIGGLYWLWSTADQHTEDGFLDGLTLRAIDRKTGINGFADALVSIGWIEASDSGVCIVNFGDHNGTTAKKRASTAQRVAKHRTGNDDVTPKALQSENDSVTGALAREEKNIFTTDVVNIKRTRATEFPIPDGVDADVWADFLKIRKAKRAPVTDTAMRHIASEAAKAGVTLNEALRTCCARGWQGFKADWIAPPSQASPRTYHDDRKQTLETLTAIPGDRHDRPANPERCIDGEAQRLA